MSHQCLSWPCKMMDGHCKVCRLDMIPGQGPTSAAIPSNGHPGTQSDDAIRILIAKEIWRYHECEEFYGPFDRASDTKIGMAEVIKQTAIDQAELIRALITSSPVIRAYFARQISEDDVYEIGKRDGYEDAIQTLDIETGGDGEFKGSTIPGATVDVPAMQARIIARFNAKPG